MTIYPTLRAKCLVCHGILDVEFVKSKKRYAKCHCHNQVEIRFIPCFSKSYSRITAIDLKKVKVLNNHHNWVYIKQQKKSKKTVMAAVDSDELLKTQILMDCGTGKRVYHL